MSLLRIVEGERDEALAENARLQERVEEAEGGARMVRQELDAAVKREKTALEGMDMAAEAFVRVERDRDRYKALAERRKDGDELWRRVRALVGRLSGEQDVEVFAFLVGLIGRWTELNQAAIEEEK